MPRAPPVMRMFLEFFLLALAVMVVVVVEEGAAGVREEDDERNDVVPITWDEGIDPPLASIAFSILLRV